MFLFFVLLFANAQQAALLDIYLRGQKAYGDIAAAASEHSCVAEASRDMLPMCKKILLDSNRRSEGETFQKILALRLTNCYLEMAGMPSINCSLRNLSVSSLKPMKLKSVERMIAGCLKQLGEQGSGAVFQVFVQQLGRVFDVCMYLDAKDFQRQSIEASELLLQSSKNASTLLSSVVELTQGSYEVLEGYSHLLNTISQNLSRVEQAAREDQEHILQALLTIRHSMKEGERELNDLILHTTSIQEQVLQKLDYSVVTLYARLDIVNDQLKVLDENTQWLTANVTSIAQRLEAVGEDTDALSQRLQGLSGMVEESRGIVKEGQEANKEILISTKLAMDSIEQQAKRQARVLTSINSAVNSISSGIGGSTGGEASRLRWRIAGPLQLLMTLEKKAPGGIIWYLALHICTQTLITLFSSGRRAVTGKRVALLIVLLSYGFELVMNTVLNTLLTFVWINVLAPFISLFGRISESLQIHRIKKFLSTTCNNEPSCLQAYQSKIRITPGMSAREIFYGYVYGLWEAEYAQLLNHETPQDNALTGDSVHERFLQYAYGVAKFSISSGTISSITRLVSAGGLALYVFATVLNVLQVSLPLWLSSEGHTRDVRCSGKTVHFCDTMDIDARKAIDVRDDFLRLSASGSQPLPESSSRPFSRRKKDDIRANKKDYERTHKKHARTSSYSL